MDGTKMQELRELVEFLKANEIAEFDMEQADLKVRIKFAGAAAAAVPSLDLAQLSRLMSATTATTATPPRQGRSGRHTCRTSVPRVWSRTRRIPFNRLPLWAPCASRRQLRCLVALLEPHSRRWSRLKCAAIGENF